MDAQRSLVTVNSLGETMQLAKMFYASGLFTDLKSEAQAGVKIIAGAELGIPPMAAMMGIDIVMGKTSLSADLMAALLKRDGRYNFRVITHTANECAIEFYENGKLCHKETYTLEMARQAGLTEKAIWKQYPRNMIYARAMSNGAKIVCPQRLAGMDISEELSAPEPVEATPEAADKATEELTGEVHTDKPAQGTNAMLFQSYIADAKVLGRFWGWAKGLGLTEADVHAALNVTSLKDVQGTVAQVKAAVQAYRKPVSEPPLFDDEQADAEMVQP